MRYYHAWHKKVPINLALDYPVSLPQTIVRKIVDASDSLEYQINTHFEDCFNFI